jgi:hypothetical protein
VAPNLPADSNEDASALRQARVDDHSRSSVDVGETTARQSETVSSRIIVVRAWQQEHGIVVRILSSHTGRATPDTEHVVASVGEACEIVRRLLEPCTKPTTDD